MACGEKPKAAPRDEIDCRLIGVHRWGRIVAMPKIAVEHNSRMSLRIRTEEKALLLRAVALNHTDLTDFVTRHALRAAKAVIEETDHVQLSERDSLRVLDLLENPPAPSKTAGSRSGLAK